MLLLWLALTQGLLRSTSAPLPPPPIPCATQKLSSPQQLPVANLFTVFCVPFMILMSLALLYRSAHLVFDVPRITCSAVHEKVVVLYPLSHSYIFFASIPARHPPTHPLPLYNLTDTTPAHNDSLHTQRRCRPHWPQAHYLPFLGWPAMTRAPRPVVLVCWPRTRRPQ